MTSGENKALCRRFFDEVFSEGKVDALREIVTTDFVDHSLPPGVPPGPEGVAQMVAASRGTFPDLAMTVEDMIAEGNRVAVRWSAQGTHTGDAMGVPPTGKRVTFTGMDFYRIAGGRVAEHWGEQDMSAVMQQLGMA